MEWTDLGGGVKRRILQYNEEIMMVEVGFDLGAKGDAHSHHHTQTTYVAKGKFEFHIGDEVLILNVGDSCLMKPGIEHSCVCLEEGVLVDVFSPCRKDFL